LACHPNTEIKGLLSPPRDKPGSISKIFIFVQKEIAMRFRTAWVVHYVYTAGAGSDPGDTYYVRSADNGSTWSTPLKLNTDHTPHVQWMPSLAVTINGKLMASWYDRRNISNYDYQRYARVSLDNGLTWQPDQPISDQVIPQPAQPDPNMVACYAGDYDYSYATGQTIYSAWTDGRVQIGGVNQQDVYLDKVNFGEASIPVCTAVGAYGWSAVAALPTAVYGPGVTSDANFVYAAGGYNIPSGASNQFAHYSPVSNTWTPLMPLPAPTNDALAVYAQGKVYVFGGEDNHTPVPNSLDTTQIYTPANNSWSFGASMPGGALTYGRRLLQRQDLRRWRLSHHLRN
jgi:hypothetical protein